ncbi:hypothetical protein [Rhodovulum adriaticum]|uniref:Uncharacterized protein n=1 Tax=Rhodovulum adriaticum TaxID=35804 RepID=A0A4R2NPH9_RHOAD|nr:hypothetical protein [Rhodovulum adriaticum]MBK1634398.1 hypothetical protein [Rhodovulum adriaticum]TCP23234.1 hypothetical protein EV656_104209 [Rhodovulum adriaticum]
MKAVPILLILLWAAPAAALELDCVARLACVSNLDAGKAACQETEIAHRLSIGRKAGSKVIVTTDDGDKFYEFTRLEDREGLRVQATGGALEDDQGAGALSVFDTLDFVVTRHNQVALGDDEVQTIAVTIHGTCEETR